MAHVCLLHINDHPRYNAAYGVVVQLHGWLAGIERLKACHAVFHGKLGRSRFSPGVDENRVVRHACVRVMALRVPKMCNSCRAHEHAGVGVHFVVCQNI